MEINTIYDSIKKPHHLEYKPVYKNEPSIQIFYDGINDIR